MIGSLVVAATISSTTLTADAATATGTTAARTQLQASPKITGGTTILWIPANTKLTLTCLAVGEKAYGAVASADPYYFKTTYGGKTGYAIDADLYTAKDADKLGLTYCSIPAQPSPVSIGTVTDTSVVLKWSDKSNNETSFKTQYSTDGGKTWKAGPSAGKNATSKTITGLKASTKYTFQVGASNNKGTKWSAYVTATTKKKPVAPSANLKSPFPEGDTWYVYQGYQSGTHSGGYGLDLTTSSSPTSSKGKSVRAVAAGKVYYWQASHGNLCVNTNDGRSYSLAHISSNLRAGASVTSGQIVGTIAAAGQASNNNVAHLHLNMWSRPGCYKEAGGSAAEIPFASASKALICGFGDLPKTGTVGVAGQGTHSGKKGTVPTGC